jgi:hypothetical protein
MKRGDVDRKLARYCFLRKSLRLGKGLCAYTVSPVDIYQPRASLIFDSLSTVVRDFENAGDG